jgi:uncharacterized membrane protein YphA (DoxX/SURF4 family)
VKSRPALLLAYGLPAVETICGLCLLLGWFTPIVVVITFSLLWVFTAAINSTFWRGQLVDCGCFGQQNNPHNQQTRWTIIYRNLGLMVLLLLIYHFGPGGLTVDIWSWPYTASNTMILFWLVLIWGLLVIATVWLKKMVQKSTSQSIIQAI